MTSNNARSDCVWIGLLFFFYQITAIRGERVTFARSNQAGAEAEFTG
jgi:hypothetical protein